MDQLTSRSKRSAAEFGVVYANFRNDRSWRSLSVLVVIFALAFAVATRYTGDLNPGTPTASSITQPDHASKRQHIDKSSFTWAFSLASCIGLVSPPVRPSVTVINSPLAKVFYGENSYNRPPPFTS
jgi:hypothetical protein